MRMNRVEISQKRPEDSYFEAPLVLLMSDETYLETISRIADSTPVGWELQIIIKDMEQEEKEEF